MAGYIFLIIGGLCAIIGRVLLASSAFGVSVWWGIGVFLPFGPLLFRLSHPGLAPLSAKFRLAVLPCFFMFFVLEPGGFSTLHKPDIFKSANAPAAPTNHYATEKLSQSNLAERGAANNREFERLKGWAEALRLKKRDLLRSDVKGNVAYEAELAQYEDALAKATAEKNAIFGTR